MSLHRDPGVKSMIGAIDALRYWRYVLLRVGLGAVCATLVVVALVAASRLVRAPLGGPAVNLGMEMILLAFATVAGAVFYLLFLRSAYQKPTSISAFVPGDPGFVPDPDITPDEWAALRSGPAEPLLRDLYERPATRNRIADEAGQAPAATFDAFKAQAARLRNAPPAGPIA